MNIPSESSKPLPVVVARTPIHRGRKFDYEQVLVRSPGIGGMPGREHTRELVRHPGAVVVVPVLPPGGSAADREHSVVLIRVFRASIEALSWECCAGTLERGEDPAACAGRELIEETGYRAGTITPLGAFRTSPGLSDEMMHAYAATDLTHVGQDLEDDEDIEVHVVPVSRALAMLDRGELADGKSIAAILLALRRGMLG